MFLQAIVLGITQGITEFLPISSDGHLILVPGLFGWGRFGLGFDVALHLGTLLATVGYFRHELASIARAIFSRDASRAEDRRLGWLIIWGTVPSVIVALAAEGLVDSVETYAMSTQISLVGAFLLATCALLGLSEVLGKRFATTHGGTQDAAHIPLWKALAIGFAQGFAVAPGLSRSGTTIATGLALGMDREQSARFSFLLSVPIVTAATAKKLLIDVVLEGGTLPSWPITVTGIVVTTIVGYAAIAFLLPFVRRHTLGWFAAYTGLLGAGILFVQGWLG